VDCAAPQKDSANRFGSHAPHQAQDSVYIEQEREIVTRIADLVRHQARTLKALAKEIPRDKWALM